MRAEMVASFDNQLAEIFNLHSRFKKSPHPNAIEVLVDYQLV